MAKTPKQMAEELKNSQLGGAQTTANMQPNKPIPSNFKFDVSKPTNNNINNNQTQTPQQNNNIPTKLPQPEFSNTVGNNSTGTLNLPNGKTFVGINNQDAQNLTSGFLQSQNPVKGAVPIGTAQNEASMQQNEANRQARLQQLMQGGTLSPQELQAIQEAPIDWGQAGTAGLMGALPGIAGGVAGGAAIGAFAGGVGAVPGAIIGGIGGAITGILAGVRSNIKSQQSGEIAATKDVLTQAKTNMRALSAIVSKDPTQAEVAINDYYDQLAQVQRAQRKLQLETQGNLNSFMNDGTQDLSDFQLFLQPGGYADIQLIRLQTAIQSGAVVSDEELMQIAEDVSDE